MEKVPTIKKIDEKIIVELDCTINRILDFERNTGIPLNITGTIGEILACKHFDLTLQLKKNNIGFDAWDINGDTVQIKTRRDGKSSYAVGKLIDKNGNPLFDYVLLVSLDKNYKMGQSNMLLKSEIRNYFDHKKKDGENSINTMTISQFKALENVNKDSNKRPDWFLNPYK